MPRQVAYDFIKRRSLGLKAQPTTLRRCLKCDGWMRSTGVDHRVCNHCKGNPTYGEPGSRIVKGD